MSILVELAIFPTDKGDSVSKYVSRVIKMIDESGAPYKLNPMGTVFETDSMPDALEIIEMAYKQLENDCNRIYATMKFDIRKDKDNRLSGKIESIEKKIGKKVNK